MRHPLLDVGLFRNARFTAASLSVTAAFFALFGFIFLITQYLQLVQGYSPLEAGLRTLPFAIATGRHVSAGHRRHAPLGVEARRGRRARRHVAAGFVIASRIEVDTPYLGLTVDQHGHHRHRPGPDDRPGHRVDHGRPARGEGRRGLRRQRHHPRARRHPGRRRRRLRLRERLRRGARRRPAATGAARRASRHRRRVDGRSADDRPVAARRRRRRRGERRAGRVHRRAVDRIARGSGVSPRPVPSSPWRSCRLVSP